MLIAITGFVMLAATGCQVVHVQDQAGNPIIAAIHIAVKQKSGFVNRLASIYGKDKAPRWIIEQISKGRLLYIDKKKALRLPDSTGFQLPGDVLSTARADDARHTGIITPHPHEVKDNERSKAPVISKKKGHNDENQ